MIVLRSQSSKYSDSVGNSCAGRPSCLYKVSTMPQMLSFACAPRLTARAHSLPPSSLKPVMSMEVNDIFQGDGTGLVACETLRERGRGLFEFLSESRPRGGGRAPPRGENDLSECTITNSGPFNTSPRVSITRATNGIISWVMLLLDFCLVR